MIALRSILLRIAIWLIFGGMAILALYFWQVHLFAIIAIMIGTAATITMLLFLCVTVRNYNRSYFKIRCQYVTISPARDVIPEEFWEYVLQTVDDLSPYGFKVRGHFRMDERGPGIVPFITILENQKERDIVRLVVAFVPSKKASRPQPVFVVSSEFLAGKELVTANNRILSGLPMPKDRLTLWLPDVRDARELYRIHQQAAHALGFGEKRSVLDDARNPSGYLEAFSQGEIARWIELGYYKPDGTGEEARITWKGAIQITWKQIPPVKELYERWRRYQTNKLLQKLEQ